MKTYQPSAKDIKREIHTVDAKGEILGRLATKIAMILMGKNKASYSANIDSGDFVTVTNAKEIVVTGKKEKQKYYRRHSGYPGGFKEARYDEVMATHPERIIEHAVSGMIPDNKLKDARMKRLTVKI